MYVELGMYSASAQLIPGPSQLGEPPTLSLAGADSSLLSERPWCRIPTQKLLN